MNWKSQRFILIGLIVVLAAAVWLMRSLPLDMLTMRELNPPAESSPNSNMTYDQTVPAENAVPPLLSDPQAALDLQIDITPAGLPVYPNATRLIGRRQTDENAVEEFAVWSIADADLAEVERFYLQAAIDAGFGIDAGPVVSDEPEPLGDSGARSRNILCRRDGQTLILRLRSVGSSIRISLILRYTMQP